MTLISSGEAMLRWDTASTSVTSTYVGSGRRPSCSYPASSYGDHTCRIGDDSRGCLRCSRQDRRRKFETTVASIDQCCTFDSGSQPTWRTTTSCSSPGPHHGDVSDAIDCARMSLAGELWRKSIGRCVWQHAAPCAIDITLQPQWQHRISNCDIQKMLSTSANVTTWKTRQQLMDISEHLQQPKLNTTWDCIFYFI